jgi:hypothetical protein
MVGKRNHSRFLVAILIIVGSLGPMTVRAEEPWNMPPTIDVSTNPDSAVIDATAGSHSDTPITSSRPHKKCYLERNDSIGFVEGLGRGDLISPDGRQAYWLICGDRTTLIFIDEHAAPRAKSGPSPKDVALNFREEIPMPNVTVRVNPDIGLVGAESWFWIEGYSGTPIIRSTNALGQPVEVEARVTRYEWSFGDGGVFTGSSTGRAYPERSEVRHTYQRSSAGLEGGYKGWVNFVFVVRYRIGTGEWTELPGITRTSSFQYSVQESQAVRSR